MCKSEITHVKFLFVRYLIYSNEKSQRSNNAWLFEKSSNCEKNIISGLRQMTDNDIPKTFRT